MSPNRKTSSNPSLLAIARLTTVDAIVKTQTYRARIRISRSPTVAGLSALPPSLLTARLRQLEVLGAHHVSHERQRQSKAEARSAYRLIAENLLAADQRGFYQHEIVEPGPHALKMVGQARHLQPIVILGKVTEALLDIIEQRVGYGCDASQLQTGDFIVVPKLHDPVLTGSGEQPNVTIAMRRAIVCARADNDQRNQRSIIELCHPDILGMKR